MGICFRWRFWFYSLARSLSIQRDNGTTLGSSTGTVTSSNSTSYTLRNKGGSTFIVIVNVNIIVSINSPIPLDNGGTKSPEGILSPTKPSGTTTKYTVTFDDNDATSGIAPDAQTVTAGSSITLPSGNGLAKTGFTFGGWNTNAYGTGANYNAGSSFTPTANITLYAKWDNNGPTYTVIYDANGATSGIAPDAQTVTAGSKIFFPSGSGLSKTGHLFGGWNTDASGMNWALPVGGYTYTDLLFFQGTQNSITLYAMWVPTVLSGEYIIDKVYYRIFFYPNGTCTVNYGGRTVNATYSVYSLNECVLVGIDGLPIFQDKFQVYNLSYLPFLRE